ncbi:beta-ketoacyl-ACP synthase III [Quisquiliibacterium transsilvanicum]|uniref:Beta-ketoacyl-[acyl-carrier-protein] synthase III n=1 Tax=Quisquiliibacterium transsilvanicum TaxID=1549638 RepID=A0A7W8HE43_9BURK|nr:beta-ketoacyl-ACP synthase III [Quisquiliibacterium transsilvanicum]MBB5270286.1 3-oxoacyl-[acyl-carrier-protein] synthase-3 [Quisquiliibacterium transsilvanicum]
MNIHSRIIGTGSALPERVVTNEQLSRELAERGLETSDEWIVGRTGIRQRHIASPETSSSMLATQAAREALSAAGVSAESVDLIIVATSTPDYVFPSAACLVQKSLGISGGAAFDVQAVCSGFVYGLATADAMIRTGMAKRALVIGAEVFSRILDWNDRGTCVLFGDGAGAVLLSADSRPGILASKLHADGRYENILRTAGNVSGGGITGHPFLTMDGPAVFKLAVSVLDSVARETVAAAGLTLDDVDWLIPHQANLRILQATGRKLGLPAERVIVTVDRHANTSAASIPLALDVAVRDGRIKAGDRVLMEGVGGGFTWGAVFVQM